MQTSLSLYNNSHLNHGMTKGRPNRHFLFDVGSSMFEASLSWLICAYSQRKISFNALYAWEPSTLEPKKFWHEVPDVWKPYFHFYNTPVTSRLDSNDSPLRFIHTLADVDDFIALKLDLDDHSIEDPMIQHILKDPTFAGKIDELFLSFRFHCEIHSFGPWEKSCKALPRKDPVTGALLDRVNAFNTLMGLRHLGIRAHTWPGLDS